MAQNKIEQERERKRKAREKARKEALARQPRKGKSVAQFCAAYNISRSTFEEWRRRKPPLGPAELQPIPGGRIIITEQAEADWAAQRTAQPAAIAPPAE
jgi:hypothetical protein